jgi:hypothetical protein
VLGELGILGDIFQPDKIIEKNEDWSKDFEVNESSESHGKIPPIPPIDNNI